MDIIKLVNTFNNLFNIYKFEDIDYANNGLQISCNKKNIKKITLCVDISEYLIDYAIQNQSDMIITHHGISYKDNLKYITNINYNKINKLIKNDICLYSIHLPLDNHHLLGNNISLINQIIKYNSLNIPSYGGIFFKIKSMNIYELAQLIDNKINHMIVNQSSKTIYCCNNKQTEKSKIFHNNKNNNISRIYLITGSINQQIVNNLINEQHRIDCIITGEMKHDLFFMLNENKISIITVGHYRTEFAGIANLSHYIKEKLKINTEIANIPTTL